MSIKSGKLEKMTIIAYKDEGFSSRVGRIKVQVNPSSYNQTKKHNYTETPTIGGTQIFRFGNEEAETQTFEFIFDESGVIPESSKETVKNQVKKFVKLVYQVNGEIHTPNNILLSWGTLQFRCFCESIDIEYTHFNRNGIPIRAKIKADFKQKITHKQYQKKVQKNSPDMTHYKVVSAGVNLPGIAYNVYKDPSYCIELAQFNKLDSFRNLKQGIEIIVPPLKA
ncbi:CIS tube protein [Flavivirga jejuensis]|uniref:Contractile injection system tube protein N-terminal domain-containing protein n=1 Tax=Flavivirga jejuensis TaxID=870487 RepID=A0ABT8WPS8_9FLAO|nr:hypothetical protein [Flavivirga jejuensis]MDO5974922.1 hypothetical protein [Flavivirga jejuensis]